VHAELGKAEMVTWKVCDEGMIIREFGCFVDRVCCTRVSRSSCISCIFVCGTRCMPNTLVVIVHCLVVRILKSGVRPSWVTLHNILVLFSCTLCCECKLN
jgi:hypothetical protein